MNKRNFTVDDFIGEEINGETKSKVHREAKISDFANIKISMIDPRIRSEVEFRIKNIKQNLNKLKHL